jgi:sialidase-1
VQNWARYSDDNGATWSEPVDITNVARDVEAWGCSVFGPGGPIQDRRGRLILPMSRTTGVDVDGKRRDGPWNAYTVYSDDDGATWHRGALVPDGEWSSEQQVVELADGSILMDMRQNEGPHRWLATSDNGGETWSVPRPGVAVTRVACAIERYTLRSRDDDRDRIVWTGPKGPGRKELVIRTSYDEGATFTGERTISTDLAAYSDLTVMPDGTIGVLWERGDYKAITLSRLDRAFLEP